LLFSTDWHGAAERVKRNGFSLLTISTKKEDVMKRKKCGEKNPWMIVLMAALVFVLGTTGYASDKDDALRILLWQAPGPVSSPYLIKAYKEIESWRMVFEPLASFDAEGKLVPILAAEIPSEENGGLSPDKTSVTWKLKQGVKWADGTEFTADDVIFTFRQMMNPEFEIGAAFQAIYESVEQIEKTDRYSVKIIFKSSNLSWFLPFTGRLGMIVPAHRFKPVSKGKIPDFSEFKEFIGTGPYVLKECTPQETLIIGGNVIGMIKIVYEANPVFREPGKPYFSRVELLGGGDAGAAAAAVLKDGVADFAYNVQVEADILARLESEAKGRILQVFGPDVECIMLNFTDPRWDPETDQPSSLTNPNPFFKDKRVRQAIAHAIDRDAVAALYGKAGRPAKHVVVSPPIYQSKKSFYEFDPGKAAALLDEAGWKDHDKDGIRDKDGMKMALRYQTTLNPLRQKIQELIKKNLNGLGIEVNLKAIESSVFFGKLEKGRNKEMTRFFYADLQEYYTGNQSPDPISYLKRWHSSDIPQITNNWAGYNFERWANPEYDALYEKAVAETNAGKRRDLMIRMNDMIVEEVVRIPLVNRALINAAGDDIDGVELTPWDASVWKIKDWKRKK